MDLQADRQEEQESDKGTSDHMTASGGPGHPRDLREPVLVRMWRMRKSESWR